MKTIKFLFLAFIAMSMNTSCSAQTSEEKETKASETDKVQVYYFHFTRRCATCNAVEKVSKETVAGLNRDRVSFVDYNLDEEVGKAKAKELQVSGQSLLVVSGETKINLTNEGFMNARSNPEKLKTILKEKIESLL